MLKNKFTMPALALGVLLLGGAAAGATAIASAQSTTTSNTPSTITTTTTNTPTTQTAAPKIHGHAPIGGDGIVSSVSGNTIVMGEEADEGGASYTVDASGAKVMVDGAAGTISDIKAGQKIFVQGNVNGTSVSATSISVGHPGWGRGGPDNDGGAASEANEPASSTDTGSDQ